MARSGTWLATKGRHIVQALTHLLLDKMAAISYTIFSNDFREWKVLYID